MENVSVEVCTHEYFSLEQNKTAVYWYRQALQVFGSRHQKL